MELRTYSGDRDLDRHPLHGKLPHDPAITEQHSFLNLILFRSQATKDASRIGHSNVHVDHSPGGVLSIGVE